MKGYRGFLIDLDGTIYRGNEVIEEAVQFIDSLQKRNLPYLFVTNNSSKTPEYVANKLMKMGINVTRDHIFTSSMATAKYIKQQYNQAKIYKIGGEGLEQALLDEGFTLVQENADLVIIGIDQNITYEKLAQACFEIRKGAKFISTNADKAIPTERGLAPGNGALTSVLEVSTGVKPIFIGKPEPIIIEQAMERLGTKKEETLLIGDNYDTDILAGIRAGIDTLIVHSGVTTKEMLQNVEIPPTYSVNSLAEWIFEE